MKWSVEETSGEIKRKSRYPEVKYSDGLLLQARTTNYKGYKSINEIRLHIVGKYLYRVAWYQDHQTDKWIIAGADPGINIDKVKELLTHV